MGGLRPAMPQAPGRRAPHRSEGEYRRELRARRPRPAAARGISRSSSSRATARGASGPSPRSSDRSARLAGALRARGVGRGDVVMTLIGNRPEWVLSDVRLLSPRRGRAALHRAAAGERPAPAPRVARPSLIIADERNRAELEAAEPRVRGACSCPTRPCSPPSPHPRSSWRRRGPLPDHVHERHLGRAEGRRARPALPLRPAPAGRALAGRARGRAGVVHGRLGLVEVRAQRVHRARGCRARRAAARRALRPARAPRAARARAGERAVHGADRVPRDRRARDAGALPDLRGMVAAGEALNPEVLRAWREATGLDIRDGYGQTETGQLTGIAPSEPARPGSMGRALPGVALSVERRRADRRPGERADVLPRLPRRGRRARRRTATWRGAHDRRDGGPWHTGDRVREDEDGYLGSRAAPTT